jgi:MFS family permease
MRLRAPYVVASAIALATMGSNLPSPLYVLYQDRFNFSAFVLTAVFAVYAAGVLAALLLVGRASDVLGRRRVLLPALVLLTVSTVLFVCAQGVGWLFAARLVQGFATGTLTPAATASLVDLDRSEGGHRGALASAFSFISGAAVGCLLAGIMAQYLPDPTVLPFLVELGLDLSGILGLVLLPSSALQGATGLRWRLVRPSVPAVARQTFVLAAMTVAVSWSVGSIYGSLSPSMLVGILHLDSHLAAGSMLFLFNGVGGLTQIVSRRMDAYRIMRLGVITTVLALAGLQLAFAERSTLLFVVATVVAGTGNGACFAGSVVLINRVSSPRRRAEINTAYSLTAYLALSVPAVGVGLLTGLTGLRSAALIFSAVIGALSLVALLLGRRHPGVALLGASTEGAVVAAGDRG